MGELAKEILPVNIEDELKQSYLDYAMSVIVGRALPDARDGLKPVHRRVLFAMHELGNDYNKPYKKSARVVGDVIGKYHPHGDTAVYDTIVRMAQPFSLRYTLIDGQGNFGSIDGDNPAAMRYTEIRMDRIAHELLADLEKETVDYGPNYDGTEQIPVVLPTRVPNLLVNGSSGSAVGMATNIPPHNLGEVIAACLHLIDDPAATIDELMMHIPGPDFPTAGIINGRAGILEAYRTGRGRIYLRARHVIETDERNRERLVITEIPYQVNKARLVEKIADLVREKSLEGISELRDESSKEGIRVVIELKRGENAEVVLNNLFSQTQLESVFGINVVALVDGEPRTLNLKQMLECFLRHRREVVTRRTLFDLRKARERGHILEGQAVALANIDPVIAVIKASANAQEARERLMQTDWLPGQVLKMLERSGASSCRPQDLAPEFGLHDGHYRLSEAQAQSILDLRLQKLTNLESEKIFTEYQEILENIASLLEILEDPNRLLAVIREELEAIREQYADERRTAIEGSRRDLTVADLIPEENVVVSLSHRGYAKNQPLADYESQRRGGRGRASTAIRDEDFIERLLVTSSHATLLCFTTAGKVYWLRPFEIPQSSRTARGRPLINILPLSEHERVTALLPVTEYDDDHFVVMATRAGVIKKTPLSAFARPRSNGLIALSLNEGDSLIGAAITNGHCELMLFGSHGKAVRFAEEEVRAMGRTATGVRGIRLPDSAAVVSLIIARDGTEILTASRNGYGKRTPIEEFPAYSRGSQGVIAIQCTERNGELIAAVQINAADELMLISDQGTLVRTRTEEVPVVGRNTQGVRLIRLAQTEHLVGVACIAEALLDADSPNPEEPEEEAT